MNKNIGRWFETTSQKKWFLFLCLILLTLIQYFWSYGLSYFHGEVPNWYSFLNVCVAAKKHFAETLSLWSPLNLMGHSLLNNPGNALFQLDSLFYFFGPLTGAHASLLIPLFIFNTGLITLFFNKENYQRTFLFVGIVTFSPIVTTLQERGVLFSLCWVPFLFSALRSKDKWILIAPVICLLIFLGGAMEVALLSLGLGLFETRGKVLKKLYYVLGSLFLASPWILQIKGHLPFSLRGEGLPDQMIFLYQMDARHLLSFLQWSQPEGHWLGNYGISFGLFLCSIIFMIKKPRHLKLWFYFFVAVALGVLSLGSNNSHVGSFLSWVTQNTFRYPAKFYVLLIIPFILIMVNSKSFLKGKTLSGALILSLASFFLFSSRNTYFSYKEFLESEPFNKMSNLGTRLVLCPFNLEAQKILPDQGSHHLGIPSLMGANNNGPTVAKVFPCLASYKKNVKKVFGISHMILPPLKRASREELSKNGWHSLASGDQTLFQSFESHPAVGLAFSHWSDGRILKFRGKKAFENRFPEDFYFLKALEEEKILMEKDWTLFDGGLTQALAPISKKTMEGDIKNIRLNLRSDGTITFKTSFMEPRLLSLPWRFMLGYKAHQGLKQLPIFRVNGWNMGLFISPGDYQFKVTFSHKDFLKNLAISWMSFFVLAAMLLKLLRVRARKGL